MNQILLAFITGITTGGISCFAVQGGLLAGIMAEQKESERKRSLSLFLISKFISHLILGGLLGVLGSKLILSSNFQGVTQIVSGIFILLMAPELELPPSIPIPPPYPPVLFAITLFLIKTFKLY